MLGRYPSRVAAIYQTRFDSGGSSIDSDYMAGISLTHGLPRQHIWSFVNAQNELTSNQACPCIQDSTDVLDVPLFVGNEGKQ